MWLAAISVQAIIWLFYEYDPEKWSWSTYPWLISWPGYYVRRGFVGEIIGAFSHFVWVDPRVLILVVYTSLSSLFAYCLSRLAAPSLLLTAATIGNSFGLPFYMLTPDSILRHDAFFLSSYAFFCLLLVDQRYKAALFVSVLSSVLLPLIHEGVALYYPFFFVAWNLLSKESDRSQHAVRITMLIWIATMILTTFLTIINSQEELVYDVCREIANLPHAKNWMMPCEIAPPLAFYAISNPFDAIKDVLFKFLQGHMNGQFLAFYLLISTWFILTTFATIRRMLYSLALQKYSAAVAIVAPSALFLLGQDWGRWQHLYHMALAILALAFASKNGSVGANHNRPTAWPVAATGLLVGQPLFVRIDHTYGAKGGLLGKLVEWIAGS